MTATAIIDEELGAFSKARDDAGLWAVPTHCLYPSNTAVTAFISGGPNSYVVSDNGGAIGTLTVRGLHVPNPDRMLKQFCVRRGLHTSEGAIVTRPVSRLALVPAIIVVANAASAAAHWGVEHLKPRPHRDLKKALLDLLSARYSKDHIRSHVRLTGDSTRQYTFDHMVSLDGRELVVDAVAHEGNAVNAKTIAHLDLARKKDPNLIQRIVYDETEEWSAADLSLMQMGAPLIQLGSFGAALDDMRLHHALH